MGFAHASKFIVVIKDLLFIYHQIIIPHSILLPRRNFKHYSVKDPGFLPEGITNPKFFVKFSKKNPMNCEKG